MSCVQKYIYEHIKYSPFSPTWFVFPLITQNWQCCGIISSAICGIEWTAPRDLELNQIQSSWCFSFDSFLFRHLSYICPWTSALTPSPAEQAEASWQEQRYCAETVKMQRGGRKKMLQSPLLLSLIKFSGLITIKPLSMYNNVCITEQHRCSPSTQLNIKVAVAVLIPARCVCETVCLPRCCWCRLETRSSILSATSDAPAHMTYIHRGALCARDASLNKQKTAKNPHECMNIPEPWISVL